MSGFYVPENQTVCWSVYKQAIANESRLPHEFLKMMAKRIMTAFDYGEPIWMIVAELELRYKMNPRQRREKTPLEMAIRVVRA
jgi:hypothetical protein